MNDIIRTFVYCVIFCTAICIVIFFAPLVARIIDVGLTIGERVFW